MFFSPKPLMEAGPVEQETAAPGSPRGRQATRRAEPGLSGQERREPKQGRSGSSRSASPTRILCHTGQVRGVRPAKERGGGQACQGRAFCGCTLLPVVHVLWS